MKWLSRSFSHGALQSNVRNLQHAKRRLLKKIGLRRNQPLNFPIPIVLDDFTKLARLNLERLKDADPQLRKSQPALSPEGNQEAKQDEGPDSFEAQGRTSSARGFRGQRIRYLPHIIQSPDAKYIFDPKTNAVTSAKAKINQDVDVILQTFRDLQQNPPSATLPTSQIRLVRSGPVITHRSGAGRSGHDRRNRTDRDEKRSYATLSTRSTESSFRRNSITDEHVTLSRSGSAFKSILHSSN